MKCIFLTLLSLAAALASGAQNSWHYLPDTGMNYLSGRCEDIYFTDSATGYAVNLQGYIYKTTDAGRHWKDQLNRPLRSTIRSIEFLDDKVTGLAGCLDTAGKLYRTTDAGNTWTNIAGALPDSVPGNKKRICGIAHHNSTFYATGSWGQRPAKLYKSTDKGMTWKCYYPDTGLISYAVDIYFRSEDTGFITGAHTNFLGYLTSVVLKTTDGGISWRRVFSDVSIGGRIWKIQALSPTTLVGSIEPFIPYDTVAMIKSMDGGDSWKIMGTGFSQRTGTWRLNQTQGIGFINDQHGWLGGYYYGLYETKDGGLTWDTVSFGSNFNRFFVIDSNHMYAGGTRVYFYGGNLPEGPKLAVPAVKQPHNLYPVTPNPATGKVKIEFDLLNPTYVLLQVASIDSRRSWEITGQYKAAGHYVYYWDGSQAPAGKYLIWLGTNEVPIVQKITLRN